MFNSLTSTTKWVIIAVVLLASVALCVWLYTINTRKEGFVAELPKLLMFYSDQCGHCVEAKPEFKKLMSHVASDSKLKSKVVLELVDTQDAKNTDLCAKHNIEFIPTILFLEGESSVQFKANPSSGKPTYTDLLTFVNTNLNKKV